MASSASRATVSDSTGPKISSVVGSVPCRTSVRIVGREEMPTQTVRLDAAATGEQPRALRHRFGDLPLDACRARPSR